MRKDIVIWSFIFLSFGFLYYLMYRNLYKNISTIAKEVNSLSQKNELLKNAWFETLLSAGYDINTNLSLINDTSSVLLKNIVLEKTLIVRLSYAACRPCLERELRNVHKLEEKRIPIIIIASYPNKRSLDILLKQYNISSRAYLMYPNQKMFPFDGDVSQLYMFITDHTLTINSFFIPVQMVDDVSDTYFRYIESLFLSKRENSNFPSK